MDTAFYISAFVTLFVVIDPIGMAPLFIAMTKDATQPGQRRTIALRAVGISAGILALFTAFGEDVLGFAGISMAAFRIAGGLLLFLTALEMLFERRSKRRADHAQTHDSDHAGSSDFADPSVFPLATPLIAGPGALTAVILLSGQRGGDWLAVAEVMAVVAVVLVMVLVMFLASGLIARLLGQTGIVVVTRLLGMLLAALSVQFVLDGLRDFGLAPA